MGLTGSAEGSPALGRTIRLRRNTVFRNHYAFPYPDSFTESAVHEEFWVVLSAADM